MSYIVPNEIPKTCNRCPFAHLVFQNPLSSKTPVKLYRCQVGEAPWKIIEIDFYDKDYKDKDCPLIPYDLDKVVAELEELHDAPEEKSAYNTGWRTSARCAIEIVRKGGAE